MYVYVVDLKAGETLHDVICRTSMGTTTISSGGWGKAARKLLRNYV
jgi:hypothetical protein